MYVLNVFPIQFLAMFAYALVRLSIGSVFVYLAGTHVRHRGELRDIFIASRFLLGELYTWSLIIFELLTGTLLVLGLYTQIASILSVVYILTSLVLYRRLHSILPNRMSLFLLLSISVCLFITGAGVFAVDLPI